MSWLSSFLHPDKGFKKAQEQLDKYYQQSQGYLNPYNQFGQQSYGPLASAQNALLNPVDLQNQWIKSYQESPAAMQAEELATQHGLNSASGQGLLGSSAALKAIQSGASQIGLNDRQNYLDNLMQKYLAGAGIAQNIYGQGANAAGQLGNNAMNMGQNSAQLAYNQQNASGGLFGGLLGLGGSLLGSALGGPLGNSLGQRLGWNTMGGTANNTLQSGGQ